MHSLNARIFLTTLFDYSLKNERLRTTYLSEKLNVSKAAITEISRTLRDEGYIYYEPYQPYALTKQGWKYAQNLYKRVCILEKYFFINFKLNPFIARNEAIQAEFSISSSIIDAMKQQIPNPDISLFGQLLSADFPHKILPLNRCREGSTAKLVALKVTDMEYNQQFWQEMAFLMGTTFWIHNYMRDIEAIQIFVHNEPRHISFAVADKMLVIIEKQPQNYN